MDKRYKNLVTLLYVFGEYPELLAQKMMDFEVFTPEFKNVLENNPILDKFTQNPNMIRMKPYFKNLEEVHQFYDKFFIEKPQTFGETKPKDDKETLSEQLDNAIREENYELAAKIRNYMKTIGVEYKPSK